ncbi:hypothetical protein HDV03_001223 [Kappamyces sp. JEL0829]|nr:hypothetical protein HDV03_001223 [Kappamyces sp. JEL0829]KAJ3359875.1 hypothetical protein HDU91_004781 [Kappamyces sp. JEL0680]
MKFSLIAASLAATAFAESVIPYRKENVPWTHEGVESKSGAWLEQNSALAQCTAIMGSAITIKTVRTEGFVVAGTKTTKEPFPSNKRKFKAWGTTTCVYDIVV